MRLGVEMPERTVRVFKRLRTVSAPAKAVEKPKRNKMVRKAKRTKSKAEVKR